VGVTGVENVGTTGVASGVVLATGAATGGKGCGIWNMDRWHVLRFGGRARPGRNSGYLPPKLQHFAVERIILLRGSLSKLFDLKAELPLPHHRRNGEDRSG
jgi:hypothetical protein